MGHGLSDYVKKNHPEILTEYRLSQISWDDIKIGGSIIDANGDKLYILEKNDKRFLVEYYHGIMIEYKRDYWFKNIKEIRL